MKNKLFRIQEAASILGVSTKTLRRWDQRGRFVPTRTAGNQRRYTQEQISKLKNTSEAEPLFSETEAPRELKATHSLPSVLRGLPSNSFLRHHFFLRHKDEISETRKFTEKNEETSGSGKMSKFGLVKIGFMAALLVLSLSLAGALVLTKYNVVAKLSATKEQFAKFIANLPRLRLPSQGDDGEAQVSFVAPDLVGSVLAAATGGSDLVLNVNVPAFFSQNVGIGTTTPDASAILDLVAEDKGFLAPRMTQVQIEAIPAPATGLFVYNTDTNHYNMYNGTAWQGVFTSIGDSTIGEAFTEKGASGNSLYFHGTGGGVGQVTGGAISGTQVYTLPGATGTFITTGNLTDITKVGTIGSGVWNGTTITVANGGTGATTLTGIVLGNGSSAMTGLTTSVGISGAISDETGTGVMVFGTSPAITTSITTASTSFALVNTVATTVNFAGAATTLSIGATTGTATINNAITAITGSLTANGDVTLGDAATDTLTFTGRVAQDSDLLPIGTTGTNDLGSSSLPWDNVYANNVFAPSAGISGYWQRNSQALSPTSITDDILLGATSTSSALVRFGGITNADSWFNTGGNVGIGTTSPAQPLEVVGTIYATSPGGSGVTPLGSRLALGSPGGNPGLVIAEGDGSGGTLRRWDVFVGSQKFYISDNTGGGTRLMIDTNGNVGIGNTTPLTALDVTGSASLSANLSLRGSGTAHTLNILDNGSLNIQKSIGGDAGVATALYIQNSGNVGIGTTSPSTLFDVNSLFNVASGGNVGIGTVTPTSFKLEVGGNVGPSVGSTYDLGSSSRRWNNVYGVTANFTNLSTSLATISGTTTQDFLINSDNVTADLEDATLSFSRGTGTNSQFKWNSTTKQLSTNSSSFAILPDLTIAYSGTAALMVNQVQSQDIFTASASGTTKFTINNSGNVGIGISSPLTALDVVGSASLSANLSLRGSGTAHTFNILDNGSLNIQKSIGGDAGVATALYIQNSGNIGIGTTNPTDLLHLSATMTGSSEPNSFIALDTYSTNGATPGINFRRARGTSASPTAVQNGDLIAQIMGSGYGATGWGSGERDRIIFAAAENWTDSAQGTYMAFETTGIGTTARTERLRITAAGNVGINNITPLTALDITGSASLSANMSLRGAGTAHAFNILDNGSLNIQKSIGGDAGVATALYIQNSGNVGIGTTSPEDFLHVVAGQNDLNAFARLDAYSTNGATPGIFARRARGTLSSPLTVQTDDVLLNLAAAGYGATGFGSTRVTIRAYAAENWTDSAQGTYIGFDTATIGGTSRAERWRITDSGILQSAGAQTIQTFTGNLTLATLAGNGNILLTPHGTGKVGVGTTAPLAMLDVRGASGTIPAASVSAQTSFASMIVDNSGIGDLFTASKSGAPKFVITNAGSVGIGTTSLAGIPGGEAVKVHISGSLSGTNIGMLIENTDSAAGSLAALNLKTGASTNYWQWFARNGDLFAGIANVADYLVLKSGGNVGIGNTSPLASLDVTGSASLSANLSLRGSGTAHTLDVLDGGSLNIRRSPGGSSQATSLFVQADGNVGIGTTGPLDALSVFKDLGVGSGEQSLVSIARTGAGGNDGGLRLGYRADGSNVIGGSVRSLNSLPLFLGTSTSTQAITVLNGGNVGIGNTNPLTALDVTGSASLSANLSFRAAATNLYYLDNGNLNIQRSPKGDAGATSVLYLANNGNVGIGTTAPTSLLNVNGTLTATTINAFTLGGAIAGGGNQINNIVIGASTPLAGTFTTLASTTLNTGQGSYELYAMDQNVLTSSSPTFANITDSGLTSGRVTFASTNGLLVDDADLTFATDTLTATKLGATTLTGTIAGGGQQLNNIIIGTATPLAGTFTTLQANTGIVPDADDGAYLGQSGTGFSDLFLASGAVINFAAGDVTLTHASNVLGIEGGNVGIGNTAPLTALDVTGSASLSANLSLRGAGTAHTFNILDNGSLNIQKSIGGDAGVATALYVQNSGNVGIGTTAPDSQLTASGTSGRIRVISTTNGNNVGYRLMANSAGGTSRISGLYLTPGDTIAATFTGIAYDDTSFGLVIDGAGKVGIGTTNPAQLLDVAGVRGDPASSGTTQNGMLRIEPNVAAGGNNVLDIGISATSPYPAWIQSTDKTNLASNLPLSLNPNGGNVGIGTTNPSYKFFVQTADATDSMSIYNSNASGYSSIKYQSSATTFYSGVGGASVSNYPNLWYLHYDTGKFMVMNTSGNVGIGTTAPLTALDITGSASLSANLSLRGSGTAHTFNILDNGSLNIQKSIGGDAGVATALYIQNSGNVGIGTTIPTQKLNVYGASTLPASSGTTQNGLFRIQSTSNTVIDMGSNGNSPYQGWIQSVDGSNLATTLPLLLNPNGGNVGIGATSPTSNLQVGSTGIVTLTSGWWSNVFTAHESVDGDALTASFINSLQSTSASTNETSAIVLSWRDASTGVALGTRILAGKEGDYTTAANADSFLALYTSQNNTQGERLRIDSGGNVGIGTTSPVFALQTVGKIGVAPSGTTPENTYNGALVIEGPAASGQYINLIRAGNNIWSLGYVYNTNTFAIGLGNSTDSSFTAPGFVMTQGGNVGIGNTNPLTALDVTGSASLSANLSLRGAGTAHTFNILDNGSLNIQKSIGGDAGVATALYIQNSGNVGIGTTSPTSQLHLRSGAASIYLNSTGGGNDTQILTDNPGGVPQFLLKDSGGTVRLGVAMYNHVTEGTSGLTYTQPNGTVGTPGPTLKIIGGTHTALTASAEASDIYFNLARTVQFATGAITTQRAAKIEAPTYGFVGASTITNATTLDIAGAPVAGTNATITTGAALRISAGAVGSGTTNAYGLYVDAPTGATNNYAAVFASGNVGIGNTAPLTALDVTGSASLSANLSLRGAGTAHTFNILDNGSLNIQKSIGGDAGVATVLYIQNSGNVGIGNTAPGGKLDVTGTIRQDTVYNWQSAKTLLHQSLEIGTNNGDTAPWIAFHHYNYGGPRIIFDGTVKTLYIDDPYGDYATNFRVTGMNGIFDGNVGIGTTSPLFGLDLQKSQTATAAAQIFNTGTGVDDDGLIIKLGNTSTTVVSNTNHFISFETAGIGIVGSVQGNNTNKGVTYATSGIADFAEYFKKDKNQAIPFGSVVCFDNNGLAVACDNNSNKIIGVASEAPAFLGGENLGDRSIAVGLVGQVRTRVSAVNGAIKIGDPLTTSSISGVAVKATSVGQILGKAIESFDGQGEGTILVSVNITWYNPSVYIAMDGTLAGITATVSGIEEQLASQGEALQAQIASASASINAQTNYILENDTLFKDLKDKVSGLESKLDLLSLQFDQQASIAGSLAQIQSGQVLGASVSAVLTLGDIELNNATIARDLMVLGRTTVTDLGVTGNINAGMLAIHGLDGEINTLSGALYLQRTGLGGVDILNGKIVIDTIGNIVTAGTVTAKEIKAENYTVLGQESIGSATIPAGSTSIEVTAAIASASSKIFLTSTSLTDKQLTVVEKSDGAFKVAIPSPTTSPISFDWWIVGNK